MAGLRGADLKPPRLKKGDQVGPWTVSKFLGSGGNAEVWRARRNDAEGDLAVKVLFNTDANSEPYQRFEREVEFMSKLGSRPGVLPLVDADVPDEPSETNRAWMAMPEAQTAYKALAGEPLETVIEACACFAKTLAEIAAEFGYSHRDIKPGNLYRWNDAWCVGDFGLIEQPDADALTGEGRTIGPLYFLAPEVLHQVAPVDYPAADVWSLAKTLWVLAVEQRWPVMGPQPANQVGQRLQDLAPHGRAPALDRLVESCTRLRPGERPSMPEVAAELQTWLKAEPAEPMAIDLSAQGAELRQRLAGEIDENAAAERRLEQAYDLRDHLERQLEQLHRALEQEYPGVEIGVPDGFTESWLKSTEAAGLPEVLWREIAADKIVTGDQYVPFVFRVGYGIELLSTKSIRVAGFIEYGREGETGGDQSTVFEATAPVGTLQAERAVEEIAGKLLAETPGWLERFVRALPQRS